MLGTRIPLRVGCVRTYRVTPQFVTHKLPIHRLNLPLRLEGCKPPWQSLVSDAWAVSRVAPASGVALPDRPEGPSERLPAVKALWSVANLTRRGCPAPMLPGDKKDLMNKVTEAKKAAETHLIVRREEMAAM